MAKQYYLSSNGVQHGPFSYEAVIGKIDDREHQWTDYIYDEVVGDWMLLLEHPEFSAKLSQRNPSPPPAVKTAPDENVVKLNEITKERGWFILKEGNNYGPFSQLEIIQMLQEKSLFEHDFIFHEKFNNWKCIAEVEDFSVENIRRVRDAGDVSISEVFFRRRHARASYGASLIVHNNLRVFRGKSLEISAGGAGVLIDCSELQPGQSLFLHFQPGEGVPPFNAVCQIVSKQFVREGAGSDEPVKYGVKFTTLSQSVRDSIKTYTTKAA